MLTSPLDTHTLYIYRILVWMYGHRFYFLLPRTWDAYNLRYNTKSFYWIGMKNSLSFWIFFVRCDSVIRYLARMRERIRLTWAGSLGNNVCMVIPRYRRSSVPLIYLAHNPIFDHISVKRREKICSAIRPNSYYVALFHSQCQNNKKKSTDLSITYLSLFRQKPPDLTERHTSTRIIIWTVLKANPVETSLHSGHRIDSSSSSSSVLIQRRYHSTYVERGTSIGWLSAKFAFSKLMHDLKVAHS